MRSRCGGAPRSRRVPAPTVQTPAPAAVATASSQPTASAAATVPPSVPTLVDREQVVLARVPKALKSAKQATAEQGTKLPDLAGATARDHVVHLRRARGEGRLPVRGVRRWQAYEIYEYPKKPNPAKLMGGELPPEEAKILAAAAQPWRARRSGCGAWMSWSRARRPGPRCSSTASTLASAARTASPS